MPILDQAFLNQSLSLQIVRVARQKYGFLPTVSTLTNKKDPDPGRALILT
jgi:hypothetical protein